MEGGVGGTNGGASGSAGGGGGRRNKRTKEEKGRSPEGGVRGLPSKHYLCYYLPEPSGPPGGASPRPPLLPGTHRCRGLPRSPGVSGVADVGAQHTHVHPRGPKRLAGSRAVALGACRGSEDQGDQT